MLHKFFTFLFGHSVDSVLADFHKKIDQLKALERAHLQAAEEHKVDAETSTILHREASNEALRAASIAKSIGSLVGAETTEQQGA